MSETPSHAEFNQTPVAERPATDEMTLAELREEYKTFDVPALTPGSDRFKRAGTVWGALEARTDIEWPECGADDCDATEWKFEPEGPAYCAECTRPAGDAEKAEAVQDAVYQLVHGGESA